MLFREHPNERCPYCGGRLWYGSKRVATGWKVYRSCRSDEGCDREWMVGRIPLATVAHVDEAYDRAAAMTGRIP